MTARIRIRDQFPSESFHFYFCKILYLFIYLFCGERLSWDVGKHVCVMEVRGYLVEISSGFWGVISGRQAWQKALLSMESSTFTPFLDSSKVPPYCLLA